MKRFLLFIMFMGFIFTECSENQDPPYYEVVPVVEVYNPFFDDIETVRLNNILTVDGVSTTTSWDIEFNGVRTGCGMLKWWGDPIEYIVGTELEFEVQVLYKPIGGNGFVPVENFTTDNYIKMATWIRPYFEARDRNNPSNKFLGIEEWNDPTNGEYQAPKVIWTVTDLNTIPSSGGIASQSNLRVDETVDCDCSWIQVK